MSLKRMAEIVQSRLMSYYTENGPEVNPLKHVLTSVKNISETSREKG
jgi:hypothetical protein